MRKMMLTSVALLGLATVASAQTAGGPATASPGAQPSQTPLTSSGTARSSNDAVAAGAATPATPAAIGANKPARPRAARRRTTTAHHATATPSAPATDQ